MNGTTHTIGNLETQDIPVLRVERGHPAGLHMDDTVIVERPLSIEADGDVYTMLRTPGADRELVVGFLFSEGLIATVRNIMMLAECPDAPDVIRVKTARGEGDRPKRTLLITSSCGLCGMADIDVMVETLGHIESPLKWPVKALFEMPAAVRTMQQLFASTGGAHAAALFDAAGKVACVREDAGRHNALDKLIGHALLHGVTMHLMGVFLSGRTSLEMIAKAARAKIPLVAAVGAPTSAAVEAAERIGVTLCGFLRDGRMSVYSHEWRIAVDDAGGLPCAQ